MSTSHMMEGARIERLLDEVRAAASPLVWQRVEELLRALMELYGRGLGRLVEAVAEDARATLAADELVASLLALHGLHPLPVEARVLGALTGVAAQLGEVVLVGIEDGVARLRAVDPPPVAGAAELLEASVLEAAPELVRVEVDGLRAARPPTALVQIDLGRSRAGR